MSNNEKEARRRISVACDYIQKAAIIAGSEQQAADIAEETMEAR